MAKVPHTCFPAVRKLSNWDKHILSDLCVLGQVSWLLPGNTIPLEGKGRGVQFLKLVPLEESKGLGLARRSSTESVTPGRGAVFPGCAAGLEVSFWDPLNVSAPSL